MLLATPKQISFGLLALRVAFGCFMLVHGIQKLLGFSEMSDVFPDPLGLGSTISLSLTIAAEAGCSVLLILGLGTRLAVLPLAFTMVVALFVIHADDPWQAKELAAIYLAAYAIIFVVGPGEYSIDHKLSAGHSHNGPSQK